MAVLEKIRVRMGVFITVIIGVALLSFIIDPDTLQSAMSMFSSKYDIGEMNGKSIRYQDFQKKTEYYTHIQQLITNTSSLDERGSEMVSQRVWQDYMDELVLFPTFDKAGIKLGDEELFDLTQGKEISPVLQNERVFADESGSFSRARLVQFIQSIAADQSGTSEQYWQYLEHTMVQAQLYTKYFSLLSKSAVLNPIELRRDMSENNITTDVRFVMQPLGFSNDSTIQVSAQELKAYYEKHKQLYEQEASRDIEYVQFTIVPSIADIDRAQADAEKHLAEFSTASSLKQFLARNSDRAFDPTYFKQGELASISPALDSFAFKAALTDVLPLTKEGDRFLSARIASVKMMPDSAFVEHILLSPDAKQLADSLVNVIAKGGNLSVLAARHSLIPASSGATPGELGWVTSAFRGLDTCLTASINQPFTYSSEYGLHVFRVTKKTNSIKKVQLAIFEKTAVPSKETYQVYYNQANELVTKCEGKKELLEQAVKEKNLILLPAYGIAPGAKQVANISNARDISRWAFEAKKGAVSPVLSIDNKYFVVASLVGIHEKGIAHFEAKRGEIETELQREKRITKLAAQMKEQMQNITDINALAEKNGLTVSNQTGIAFGAFGAQQLDPKFIGAVSAAPENKISGPVEGAIGVYVFTVDARQTGAFYTEKDAQERLLRALSQQNQMVVYVLSKAAKVEDSRSNFF